VSSRVIGIGQQPRVESKLRGCPYAKARKAIEGFCPSEPFRRFMARKVKLHSCLAVGGYLRHR
ncbi:uncharacterized protein METZ01_LOCUS502111, partial [marine metagenome]